jgi:hypothetical protein
LRLHVRLANALVADPVVSEEVLSGVREGLVRLGALEAGDGYPRIEVEVLRVDRESAGIAAGEAGTSPPPVARGTSGAVVARAWLVAAPGAPRESDSGDMRAEDVIAVDQRFGGPLAGTGAVAIPGPLLPNPLASGFHSADALRASARRLGQRLARKVVGLPAASEDMGEGL